MNRSQRKILDLMAEKYPDVTIDFEPEDFIPNAFEYEIIFEGALDEVQIFNIGTIIPIVDIMGLLADDCRVEHVTNLRINREDDSEYFDSGWSVEIFMLDEQGDRIGEPMWRTDHLMLE